jgi:hypothetical protein
MIMVGGQGQSRNRWLANLDLYRKVPADLMESSSESNIFSWLVSLFMLTLFIRESIDVCSSKLVRDLSVDSRRTTNRESDKIRVNFNITMLDVRCTVSEIFIRTSRCLSGPMRGRVIDECFFRDNNSNKKVLQSIYVLFL